MKYCLNCGNEIGEKDVFCSKCGAKTSVFSAQKKTGESGEKIARAARMKAALKARDSVPGARYTAAVEQNAIAVTEYLKRASELEIMKFQTEEIGRRLKERKDKCLEDISAESKAISAYREKEAQAEKGIRDYQKPVYRRRIYNYKFYPEPVIFASVFFGLLAAEIIGGLTGIPPFSWIYDLLLALSSPGDKVSVFLEVIITFLIPVIVVCIVQGVKYFKGRKIHEEAEDETQAKYNEEQDRLEEETLRELKTDLEDYRSIISQHENEKLRLEKIVLNELEKEIGKNTYVLGDIAGSLEKFYATRSLDPKYRALVPATTMFEYFSTGKCQDLTGHEGAYNTYEKELRDGKISADTEVLTEKRDEIPEDQKYVIATLKKARTGAQDLMNSVDSVINENLEKNPDAEALGELRSSSELSSFYEDTDSKMKEIMEYLENVDYYSRRWF